jgi:hypothetical protein
MPTDTRPIFKSMSLPVVIHKWDDNWKEKNTETPAFLLSCEKCFIFEFERGLKFFTSFRGSPLHGETARAGSAELETSRVGPS